MLFHFGWLMSFLLSFQWIIFSYRYRGHFYPNDSSIYPCVPGRETFRGKEFLKKSFDHKRITKYSISILFFLMPFCYVLCDNVFCWTTSSKCLEPFLFNTTSFDLLINPFLGQVGYKTDLSYSTIWDMAHLEFLISSKS